MKNKTAIFGLALLSLAAGAGVSASGAQAGEHKERYLASNHAGGYERHAYGERRGHVRNHWGGERRLKHAQRGHGRGRH